MAEKALTKHDVRFDVANNGGRRLTCRSCGVAIVDVSGISRAEFMRKAEGFLGNHPPKPGKIPSDDRGMPAKTLDELKQWLR